MGRNAKLFVGANIVRPFPRLQRKPTDDRDGRPYTLNLHGRPRAVVPTQKLQANNVRPYMFLTLIVYFSTFN